MSWRPLPKLPLPDKFDPLRDIQEIALEGLRDSTAKYILLQGPPGTGKTAIAAGLQKLWNLKTLYTCHTKTLQHQFLNDFPDSVELMGRSNYPSRYFPTITTNLCTYSRQQHCPWCCKDTESHKCEAKSRCPYQLQKRKALGADLAVINTALLLTEANFVGQFSGWPLLVLDECDQLEQALMDFISISVSERMVQLLELTPPARKTVQSAWIDWARDVALPKVQAIKARFNDPWNITHIRTLDQLIQLEAKLEFLIKEVDEDWVYDPETWSFRPIYVHKYAEQYLWKHAERFLLMSATIISPDEMCHSLGIPEHQFMDIPSTFPATRRPIFFVPTADINRANEATTRPQAIEMLDQLLDNHLNEKALVHCVSYSYSQAILSLSRHKKRMIGYNHSKNRGSALEQFKVATPGATLVASSMARGLDLPYDQCRLIIVMKCPYLSLGDRQVSARLYRSGRRGQTWYSINAIRTLVQMTGRGMRHEDDYCECYILDGQAMRLYETWKYTFPKWWREAVSYPKNLNGKVRGGLMKNP